MISILTSPESMSISCALGHTAFSYRRVLCKQKKRYCGVAMRSTNLQTQYLMTRTRLAQWTHWFLKVNGRNGRCLRGSFIWIRPKSPSSITASTQRFSKTSGKHSRRIVLSMRLRGTGVLTISLRYGLKSEKRSQMQRSIFSHRQDFISMATHLTQDTTQ